VVFALVGSLQNVAVIISLQIVSPLVPLPVELLELPVLLLVLVAEDVLVVVWAATGDVANSDSTMRDARFISKKAPVNRPSLGDRRRAPGCLYNIPASVSFSHCQKLIGMPLSRASSANLQKVVPAKAPHSAEPNIAGESSV
jgi:hypothetical protein